MKLFVPDKSKWVLYLQCQNPENYRKFYLTLMTRRGFQIARYWFRLARKIRKLEVSMKALKCRQLYWYQFAVHRLAENTLKISSQKLLFYCNSVRLGLKSAFGGKILVLGNHEEDVVAMNTDAFVRSFRKRVSRDTLFKYQPCLCLF